MGSHGVEKSFVILNFDTSNVTRLSVDVQEKGKGQGEPGGHCLPYNKNYDTVQLYFLIYKLSKKYEV